MSPIGVMQIVDTLEAGGAERMAVALANHLPADCYRAYLCATRRTGPLGKMVGAHVTQWHLNRRHRFDLRAVWRLARFIREQRIRVLHAHSTSVFIAAASSVFAPGATVIWHIHAGRLAMRGRFPVLYRLVARRVKGIIAVNQPLADWSRRRLRFSPARVWHIPNFVETATDSGRRPELPGSRGARIVHVASLRAQKDQPTLLRAMALAARQAPEAHLLLVGGNRDRQYADSVRGEIAALGLGGHVTLLGERTDVPDILRECDIGVLSSASEGLPLALLEYGMAGLPAVATRVGDCPEVLDQGQAGLLVAPRRPDELAEALLRLLRSAELRASLGEALRCRVHGVYSAEAVMGRVCSVYDSVLEEHAFATAG